jgi:xanthosine phosphorylase
MTEAATILAARAPGLAPAVALVLGSGLGPVADAIEPVATVRYDELPGFPRPSVKGHAGRVTLGRLGSVPVVCLQGRVHLYEGVPAASVEPMIRAVRKLGCRTILLTNAAGSLRADLAPGALVLVEDHINLAGTNPLIGRKDAADGPIFLDLTEAYDRGLRGVLGATAARLGLALPGGVYLQTLGPCFETPAEIRAFRALGADLVGMSTVQETICARAYGLRVAAISVVTNLAAGMAAEPLSHGGTLDAASAAAATLVELLTAALPELAADERR